MLETLVCFLPRLIYAGWAPGCPCKRGTGLLGCWPRSVSHFCLHRWPRPGLLSHAGRRQAPAPSAVPFSHFLYCLLRLRENSKLSLETALRASGSLPPARPHARGHTHFAHVHRGTRARHQLCRAGNLVGPAEQGPGSRERRSAQQLRPARRPAPAPAHARPRADSAPRTRT